MGESVKARAARYIKMVRYGIGNSHWAVDTSMLMLTRDLEAELVDIRSEMIVHIEKAIGILTKGAKKVLIRLKGPIALVYVLNRLRSQHPPSVEWMYGTTIAIENVRMDGRMREGTFYGPTFRVYPLKYSAEPNVVQAIEYTNLPRLGVPAWLVDYTNSPWSLGAAEAIIETLAKRT